MINCMVMGHGRFGREHLLAWESCPDAQVTAVVDPAAAESSVASPVDGRPIAVFATVEEALEHSRPDVAAVVTPSRTHHELAQYLIAQGIHCLVEKPLATSSELAREVQAALGESQVTCMPGHILRFSPSHIELRDRVRASGRPPRRLSLRRDRSAALSRMYASEHPALLTGVHDIDLAYWITGSPVVEVSATVSKVGDTVVGFDAECRHESGARSRIQGSYTLDADTPDAVDDEIVLLDDADQLIADWAHREVAPVGSNEALVAEVAHFVALVSGRVAQQTVTVDDAVHVIDVAEAIVRSAEQSGRSTPVPHPSSPPHQPLTEEKGE